MRGMSTNGVERKVPVVLFAVAAEDLRRRAYGGKPLPAWNLRIRALGDDTRERRADGRLMGARIRQCIGES